jgi:hypothetical protein
MRPQLANLRAASAGNVAIEVTLPEVHPEP